MSDVHRLPFYRPAAHPAYASDEGTRRRGVPLPPLVEQVLLFWLFAGAAAVWLALIWLIVG